MKLRGPTRCAWIRRLWLMIFMSLVPCLKSEEAGSTVLRELKDRSARGTLSDQRQIVRGDSGKWSDVHTLLHVPSLSRKPQSMPLDEWMDEQAGKPAGTTIADENWLVFRTRQLDDNDRVWIEKIERKENEFIVTMHEAVWQGNYFKTFTYHEVSAVNLGKLPTGDYTVTWIMTPLIFRTLEKPREAINDHQTNWPADDQPGKGAKAQIKTAFSIR
jgi:hypothetical protein